MDMPQPTRMKENEQIFIDREDVFLKRPEIAAEAMECIRISTRIDKELKTIFLMVLSDTQTLHGSVNHHYSTIYGNFMNMRTKIDLIADMMTSKDHPCAEEMSEFYRKHKAAFSKRNVIAHADWEIWEAKRYDNGVIEGMTGYPESYWTVKDFRDAKNLLIRATEEIRSIHDHTQIFVHNLVSENLQQLALQAKYKTKELTEEQVAVLQELAKNATILKTRSAK